MAQHVGATDPVPARIVDPEYRAHVTQARRRQHRVAQRVRPHVAVGVTRTAVGAVEKQAQQPAWPSRFDGVNVDAQPDPGQGKRRVHRRTTVSASNKSSWVVILNASGSPSTSWT